MITINKTYYINLSHRKDRDDHIKQELKKSKLIKEYHRFDAIDGKKLKIAELDNEFITRSGKNTVIANTINKWGIDLTYGSVGCALSHYLIYKECVDNAYKSVLIFEDDIKISPKIDFFIDKVNQMDTNSFDILYFGSHNNTNKTIINNDFHKINSKIYGAFAYLVTFNGAKNILKNVFPISRQFDSEISRQITLGNLYCLITNPRVVSTMYSFGTDNQGRFGLLKDSSIIDQKDAWVSVFTIQ